MASSYTAPTGTGVSTNKVALQGTLAVAGGPETTVEDWEVTNAGGPAYVQPVSFPSSAQVSVAIPEDAIGVVITAPTGQPQILLVQNAATAGHPLPTDKPAPLFFERSAVSGATLYFKAAAAVTGTVKFAWF